MTENGLKLGVGVNLNSSDADELIKQIEALDGVESVDWASPACLYALYVEVAPEADPASLALLIGLIAGVESAYAV